MLQSKEQPCQRSPSGLWWLPLHIDIWHSCWETAKYYYTSIFGFSLQDWAQGRPDKRLSSIYGTTRCAGLRELCCCRLWRLRARWQACGTWTSCGRRSNQVCTVGAQDLTQQRFRGSFSRMACKAGSCSIFPELFSRVESGKAAWWCFLLHVNMAGFGWVW